MVEIRRKLKKNHKKLTDEERATIRALWEEELKSEHPRTKRAFAKECDIGLSTLLYILNPDQLAKLRAYQKEQYDKIRAGREKKADTQPKVHTVHIEKEVATNGLGSFVDMLRSFVKEYDALQAERVRLEAEKKSLARSYETLKNITGQLNDDMKNMLVGR